MNKNKQYKKFGYLLSLCFLFLTIYFLTDKFLFLIFIILTFFFILLTLCFSNSLAPFYYIWMKIGYFIGKMMNPLILGIMFFLIITPLSIMCRSFRRDELLLKEDDVKKSFWIDRRNKEIDPATLKKQY